MNVALFLVAIVAAANGVWFVAIPALFAGVVIGTADASPHRSARPVSQLRRRQLDDIVRERRHG